MAAETFDSETHAFLLELAEEARTELNAETRKKIPAHDAKKLTELLYELTWGTTPYGDATIAALGFEASVINKFTRTGGDVPTRTARALADRLVTYLRANDPSAPAGIMIVSTTGSPPQRERPPPPPFVVQAVEWTVIVRTDALEEKIAQLVSLIGDVTRHAKSTNLPPNERALSEIERAQLIAVLETAANLLKSPMVEKGIFKRAASMAKNAATKATEKQVEIALGSAAGLLGAAILEFLKRL